MPYRAILLVLAIAVLAVLAALHVVSQAQAAAQHIAAARSAQVCKALGQEPGCEHE